MAKVVVSVRMDAEVRDSLKSFADQERRTLGSFIESLLMDEQERRSGGSVSLYDVMSRLEVILDKVDSQKKRKPKNELSPIHDVSLPEGFNPEIWESWIVHKRKMGVPMNHYHAQLEADKLAKLESEERWDIELLIKELIESCAKSIYVPTQWRYETKEK